MTTATTAVTAMVGCAALLLHTYVRPLRAATARRGLCAVAVAAVSSGAAIQVPKQYKAGG